MTEPALDVNDFAAWMLKRLYRIRGIIDIDDYNAHDELKHLKVMLEDLHLLLKFSESRKDNAAGSEINRYADAFRGRSDGVHRRATDGGNHSPERDDNVRSLREYAPPDHSAEYPDDPA